MDCDNCDKEIVVPGVFYSYGELVFCGKSCLIKYLREMNIVKMKINE